MKDEVFIDPSAVTPIQLNETEMSNLSGGLPVIIFALGLCAGGLVCVAGMAITAAVA